MEGELPEDGLADFGDDGDDLMPALARKIVSRDEDDAALVEVAFAGAASRPTGSTGLLRNPVGHSTRRTAHGRLPFVLRQA